MRPSSVTDARRLRPPDYRPQLDGLRAVAVAAVAWSHWERPYQFGIPFGAGVHLFYVLSGFLITGILLDVREHAGRAAALRAFYIRRALRIFPAFYLTLALAWWADIPLVRETLAWHAAYLSNVWIFARDQWPGTISHLWSLAVEEQFYLAWPWLIVFAPRRWLMPLIVASIAAAPIFRWALAEAGWRESMHAILTPGCLDSLGVGAWLAARRRHDGSAPGVSRGDALLPGNVSPGLVAAASLLALIAIQAAQNTVAVPNALIAIKQTLQAVVFGWMVLNAADGFGGWTGRVLSSSAAVYTGKISYGIYLAHGFAGALAAALFGAFGYAWPLPEPWRFIVLVGVTFGAAFLSWNLVEAPINRQKRRFPY